jgi:hypothetical protein
MDDLDLSIVKDEEDEDEGTQQIDLGAQADPSDYEPKEPKEPKDDSYDRMMNDLDLSIGKEEEEEDEVGPWTESDKRLKWIDACGKICSLEGLQYQENTCNGSYGFLTVKKHLVGVSFKTLQSISERNVDYFLDAPDLRLFAQLKYGWKGTSPRDTEVLPGQKRKRTQKIDLCAQEEQEKENLRLYARLSDWRKELEAKNHKRKKPKLDKDDINVKAPLSKVSKSTNEALIPHVRTSTRSSSKTKGTSLRSKTNQKRKTRTERSNRKTNIKKTTTHEALKTTSEPIKKTSTIPVIKNKPVRNVRDVSNDAESVSKPTESTKTMENLSLLSKQRKEAVLKYANNSNTPLKDLFLQRLVSVGKRIDEFNQSLVATCNEKRDFEMVSEVLTILVRQREELEQVIEAYYQKEDLCVILMKQVDKVEQRIDGANKALV